MRIMNDIRQLGVFVLASFTASSFFSPAFAQLVEPAPAAKASKTTLGGAIKNLVESFDTVPGLFTGLAYLFGIFLGFWGILKLKDHVENPNNTPIWEPIKRFAAGGAFFSLPHIMIAVMNTWFTEGGGKAADYSKFNSGGAGTLGLDGMMVKLIADIWYPMHYVMYGFCYLAGIILVFIGISRLLKSEQDGARGPLGFGTIMTFMVGGALLSVDRLVGSSLQSFFNSATSTSYGVLKYTAGMGATELAHAHAVIAAIVAFVAIIGWVSFIRGLFILRGVSEGNSQASMMAAVTHILGGALAINLGGVIMAVQNTLGILPYGIEFS
jgi:hypothetical protein